MRMASVGVTFDHRADVDCCAVEHDAGAFVWDE